MGEDRGPARSAGTARWLLAAAVVAGLAVRLVLLPTPGYVDDLTEFAGWIRHIAVNGIDHAYDVRLTFGPVMVYVWGLLSFVAPGFATAVDGSDVALRILMKLPAVLADLGLVAALWLAIRPRRPGLAALAAGIVLLHPAVWLLSSWWGQYESVMALLVVLAYLCVIRDRLSLGAVFLTAALLTKPQVVPLLVPFGLWFLLRTGLLDRATPRAVSLARAGRAAAAALGTAIVLWLPFLAADGPARYLASIGSYQEGVYNVLSLNAWNFWWIIQAVFAHDALVADAQAFLGPITYRVAGYALAGTLLALVGAGLWRRPTPRNLALAIAAAALVAFTFLTTMHERYAYAAVIFLALLSAEPRFRWLSLGFGAVFTLNLVAAAVVHDPSPLLPMGGYVGKAGSILVVAATLYLLVELLRPSAPEERDAIPVQVVG